MPDEEPFGSDLASIQVVLHAALPHQKQWRHQKPLTICTYIHNDVCSGLVEASLFRTLDAIFTSTLCLDQGWRWLELLWLYW
eukprot:Em0006g266a